MLTLLKNHISKFGYFGLSLTSLIFAVRPVWLSTYAGDDWPNSQTPDLNRWRFGEKNLINLWSEIAFWNEQWFRGQGRIYSVQFIENRLIFYIFEDPHLYKIFQFSINLTVNNLAFGKHGLFYDLLRKFA